jgi:hypothetical protein
MAHTPEDIADLLDAIAQANGRLSSEVDRLLVDRAAVSSTTIDRLVRLADELRPGAAARAELRALADLDTTVLLAGIASWLQRRREAPLPATQRARQRWGGLSA